MVEKPPITVYGCHPLNTQPRPADIYYEGICTHTTGGSSTIEQLSAWFNGGNIQQGLRGSTTHGVDRAGKIGEFVTPYSDVMPIANGQESGSTAYLVRVNPGISMNAVTLNVEHLDAGTPGSITPVQFQRSIHLYAYLWQEYIAPYAHITGAVIDRDHIVQHKDFAPSSRPFCASWPESRMNELIAGMKAMLTAPVPPPDPVTAWEIKYGQLDREVAEWLRDDAAGAQMRASRLAELRAWRP